jgi:nucleotide-binding universal stress UspA family protein
MKDIKRILAVNRMTKYCPKAIYYGIALSQRHGFELSVVHIIDTSWFKGWNFPMMSVEEEYKKDLEKKKKKIDNIISREKKKGMTITEFTIQGDPTTEILKVIKGEKIDMLILVAHQESRLEHFFFGYSNEEIIEKMPCSILLVKKDPEPLSY